MDGSSCARAGSEEASGLRFVVARLPMTASHSHLRPRVAACGANLDPLRLAGGSRCVEHSQLRGTQRCRRRSGCRRRFRCRHSGRRASRSLHRRHRCRGRRRRCRAGGNGGRVGGFGAASTATRGQGNDGNAQRNEPFPHARSLTRWDAGRRGAPSRGPGMRAYRLNMPANGVGWRDTYLARLGLDAEPPSIEALFSIHHAHVERVPWETLWIHLGERWGIDVAESTSRIATQRRGGYCFHLNGALGELLRRSVTTSCVTSVACTVPAARPRRR